jgi:hypothetical protein
MHRGDIGYPDAAHSEGTSRPTASRARSGSTLGWNIACRGRSTARPADRAGGRKLRGCARYKRLKAQRAGIPAQDTGEAFGISKQRVLELLAEND